MRQHFFRNEQGFSLAELMVSVAIMSIILTVILMGQAQYSARASLNANVNEAGLTVRQAQTYGISVRDVSPGLQEFNAGFGVSFCLQTSGSSGCLSNNSYIFYADRGATDLKRYSSAWSCSVGGASECLRKTVLTGGNVISGICYKVLGAPSESCVTDNRRMDITFTRPETVTSVRLFNASGTSENPVGNVEYGKVVFRWGTSASNYIYKSLYVYSTGQISIRDGQ